MLVHSEIIDGPIDKPSWPLQLDDAGALVAFHGIVRSLETGRLLVGLDYETYDPMAADMFRQLAQTVAAEFALTFIGAIHSRGMVRVGECSLLVHVAAPHRQPALDAMSAFIDRLKQDLPIWKNPVWA